MTYSTGSVIQATDYNTFAQGGASPNANVANINTIWGAGDTLDKGWGQSTTLSTVAAAGTVTATQWATMFSRFTSIASQTNTTVTAIVNPTAGDTIAVKSNFSTNLSSCFTNRNNTNAVGSTITANGAVTYSSAWTGALTATHTITFADANSARYFFNAGGRITWGGARTGGTASSKNTSWTNLLTACGTINTTTGTSTQTIVGTSYTGTTKTGGSGTPTTLLTGTGFYDLTTSDQEVFKQFDSTYLYTSDFVSINIKANAAAGSATVITITVLYQNASSGADSPAGYETVDGTLTSTVTAIQPSTTFLTNTWGTPVLASSIAVTQYAGTYLLVGGGGGGGYNIGGGGGGGQVLQGSTALTVGTTYNITVGGGGNGGSGAGVNGVSGTSSTGFGQTSVGGGGGGTSGNAGSSGASGGGGAPSQAGGTATAGFNGGAGAANAGGGGGGAGVIGVAGGTVGSFPAGGNGGDGTFSVIGSSTGARLYYGTGGGGGANSTYGPSTGGTPNIPGQGAGGSGGYTSAAATAGTTNRGAGGGGGALNGNGGAGGSGVVVLSVATASYSGTKTGTSTTATYNGNTIITWTTGSGSYTA
jgi:hypothetical protein